MNAFWKWVTETFQPYIHQEIEKYLADSTDIKDLENRMKLLRDRGFPI
jgi:hypothetical protein